MKTNKFKVQQENKLFIILQSMTFFKANEFTEILAPSLTTLK